MDFWFTSWIHLDNFLAEGLDLLSLEETKKEKRGTLKTNLLLYDSALCVVEHSYRFVLIPLT